MDPTSPDRTSDPNPVVSATEPGRADTQAQGDAAIPMWVVVLIGRQQLELELLRDQLRTQQPAAAPTPAG